MQIPEQFSDYLELTKPGIVLSIVMTTFAGFFLGAESWSQWTDGIWLLIGTALSAACAGTLNHYLEVEADARMPRTQQRPLPSRKLAPLAALSFGVFLGLAGISILLVFLNSLTAFLAGLTIALYIWVYTPMKRHTHLNTLVGAIPGALPPLAGWTASSDGIGWLGILIFALFFFWQMPHFYALAWMYKDDYAAGGFVMLPAIDAKGIRTRIETMLYILLLASTAIGFGVLFPMGVTYYILLGLITLHLLVSGGKMILNMDRPAAVKVFVGSLLFLPGFVCSIVLDRIILHL